MSLDVEPLTSTIGVEISGVDLRQPLDTELADQIRALLHEHLVLVFRGQALSPEQQLDFGRAFGSIKAPPARTAHGGPPEINVVSQDAPKGEGADNWHADNTYTVDPPMGSILHLVEQPSAGGDTMFANMYEAFETLSPAVRALCEELTEAEGNALLALLYDHVRSPDFHLRVRWDLSTVVFIDNLATQHYAVPDYNELRTLHRVAIEGQVLATIDG